MRFPQSVPAWEALLLAAGVRASTAALWAPIFFTTILATSFSKGPGELPDFLSTTLHECGKLERLKESGMYSAARIREIGNSQPVGSRWRSLVPRADALAYNEGAFFEAVYGGRLGNDQPGDGALYPGRGLIMLTGKANYRWQGDRSGQDLVGIPDLAAQPHFALEFALDYWEGRVPDAILGDAKAIRKIINGGTIGLEDVVSIKAKITRALA